MKKYKYIYIYIYVYIYYIFVKGTRPPLVCVVNMNFHDATQSRGQAHE